MYALNNITNITSTGVFCNDLSDSYHQHNTHNIAWTTFVNIATEYGSISTFNTIVANLAALHVQDSTTMSQLLKTSQTMQSNFNIIMQDFREIKYQKNYSNAHVPTVQDRYDPPPLFHLHSV